MRSGFWSFSCGWGAAFAVGMLAQGRMAALAIDLCCVLLASVMYFASKQNESNRA